MISDMQAPAISRTAQYKKVTKPLLERKRRARINRCLDELKDLMMDALEAEGENISKLEKADILELTVRHLHRLQRPRNAVEDAQRYQAGFGQCAAEACQFLLSLPGVDTRLGHSLIKHLGACVGNGPLSIQVPNLNRLCYSPPVSPLTPIIKNNSDLPSQNNVLSSTPSVQDLSKPMTGLLMQVPVTNISERKENRSVSEKIGSPYKEKPREMIHPHINNYSKSKYGMVVENSVRNMPDDKNTKRVLRTAILERRKMAVQNPEKSVFKRPTNVVPVISDLSYEKHSEYSTNDDDDEEIDIENVEDGDNMWRPW